MIQSIIESLASDVHGLDASIEKHECCICGKEFTDYGNNPEPVKESGVCCDECNASKVIPARIAAIYN